MPWEPCSKATTNAYVYSEPSFYIQTPTLGQSSIIAYTDVWSNLSTCCVALGLHYITLSVCMQCESGLIMPLTKPAKTILHMRRNVFSPSSGWISLGSWPSYNEKKHCKRSLIKTECDYFIVQFTSLCLWFTMTRLEKFSRLTSYARLWPFTKLYSMKSILALIREI